MNRIQNENELLGKHRSRDIPIDLSSTPNKSSHSTSSNNNIQCNKIYQEKLNSKTFLSSFWLLRFNRSFPNQKFDVIETERRTQLSMKFTFELVQYNNNILNLSNNKQIKCQHYIDQVYFTITFLHSNTFQLNEHDVFNITLNVNNDKNSLEKENFTTELNYTSPQRRQLLHIPSFINHNNSENINLLLHINIEIIPKHKTEPSYTGLINKGNTCYLNSIIQMFYMIPLFTQNIEQYATTSNSTLESLKKLFISMDKGTLTSSNKDSNSNGNNYNNIKRVSPEEFIHSLECDGKEIKSIRSPHDIQEFFMIIGDIIGKETKKVSTYHPNIYDLLFKGKILTTITCKYVKYSSQKEESFNDIQLVVKDCKSIEESFNNFTANEELNGNNQYQTDKYGKQDAIKKTVFSSLPKILIIQLKRFEYNVEHKQMDKVYSACSFQKQLDLTQYTNNTTHNKNAKYVCRGVIVHSGNIDNGHYYAFIHDKNNNWYKFNDSIVEHAYEYEVFDNNYGGEMFFYTYSTNFGKITKTKRGQNASAYLLMYVREDCLSEIYCMKHKASTATRNNNISIVNNSQMHLPRIKTNILSLQAIPKIKVYLITDEIIKHTSNGLGLLFYEHNYIDAIVSSLPLITQYERDNSSYTFDDIVNTISQLTKISKHSINLYFITYNYNNTNPHDKHITYKATFINDLNMCITSCQANTVPLLNKFMFIYANEHNGHPLVRYEKSFNKWELFSSINNISSSSFTLLSNNNKAHKHKSKRFILKMPIVNYEPLKRNISLRLETFKIFDTTTTSLTSVLNSKEYSDIKNTFINHYLQEWNIMLDDNAIGKHSFNLLFEMQEQVNKYKTTYLCIDNDNDNINLIEDNDIICCVLNVDLDLKWNEKSFISFKSIRDIIEKEYTLISKVKVCVVNEKGENVKEGEVSVDQGDLSPEELVKKCGDGKERGKKWKLSVVGKDKENTKELAQYVCNSNSYKNNDVGMKEQFKQAIRYNYNAYELVLKLN